MKTIFLSILALFSGFGQAPQQNGNHHCGGGCPACLPPPPPRTEVLGKKKVDAKKEKDGK